MQLDKVIIRNFRSIEDLTIVFEPKCRVLVGINESGKSNILEALSMLSKDCKPSKLDRRIGQPDEPRDTQSDISYIFSLEKEEAASIAEEINKKILSKTKKVPLIKSCMENYTIEKFCSTRKVLYKVNIIKENKTEKYWKLPSDWEVPDNWMKPSQDCPADFEIEILEGSGAILKNYKFINIDDYKNIPEKNLSKVTPEDVNDAVGAYLVSHIKKELPDTVYWTYVAENLLPGQISLAQFAANPSMCLPLKHMFELAQVVNINEAIKEAKESSIHDLRNLLNRVSKITTDNFHKTWKEYNKVTFELMPNGDLIDIAVKDEFNHYELSKRSDGFKRFITFLLMISARVKTGMLQNAIIIIDEPDTSLHPSGAKYLREELFKISENNIVVFSTHSIFMIDKENIERHYLVKKENEKTLISTANKSNIVDEEVIYNALGCSVFENIKQKNILFEGWRDKELFRVAMEKVPKGYHHLKKTFNSIGMCHAKGVKDCRHVTPLMELVGRDCLILSDDDNTAKEKQKQYVRDRGFGVWKRYSEIQADVKAITGEDFVKAKAFSRLIANLKERHSLQELTEQELGSGKINVLQTWLEKGGVEKKEQKEIVDFIKEEIFNNLQPNQIEKNYYDFLSNLAEYISKSKR